MIAQSARGVSLLYKPDIEEIAKRLHSAFEPAAADGLDVVYQFEFGDAEGYQLIIEHGELKVVAGRHANPTITLLFDRLDTARDLIAGPGDTMQAFMQGSIRSDGNLLLAMRLGMLFPTRR